MLNDEMLRSTVADYDPENQDYQSIVYLCLPGGAKSIMGAVAVSTAINVIVGADVGFGIGGALAALANDYAIMTVNSESLCFYILNKFKMKLDITNKIELPYSWITKYKMSKFLMWDNVKIYFENGSEKHKLKLQIATRPIGLKNQPANVREFLDTLSGYPVLGSARVNAADKA